MTIKATHSSKSRDEQPIKRKLQLRTHGRTTKYGGTYGVGNQQTVLLLEREGWELVKETLQSYYLKPPEGKGCKRPIVEVKIPTDKEIQDLAHSLHEKGKDFEGELKGWVVVYLQDRKDEGEWVTLTQEHDQNGGYLKERRRKGTMRLKASFEIGSWDTWSQKLKFDRHMEWRKNEDNLLAEFFSSVGG